MSSPADTFSPLSKSPTLARARTRTNTSLTSHSSASNARNGIDHPPKPLIDPSLLPRSNAPSLRLVQCTAAEVLRQQKSNSASWRGNLSMEQYLRRESILANQDLTRDGGMSFWMLTDDNLPRLETEPWRGGGGGAAAGGGGGFGSIGAGGPDYKSRPDSERIALAGCESIRKRAFLRRKGDADTRVREVVCHGVASVFCPEEFRGRGYAGTMMRKLSAQLSRHQDRLRDGRPVDVACSVLYSDIGRDFYARNGGWEPCESRHVALPAVPPSSQIIENATAAFPLTRRLKTEDLPSLCIADEALLRRSMERMRGLDRDVLAIVPDVQSVMWMHAREDFVCQEIFTRYPEIKGAIVGMGEGKHAWCYWVRMYYNDEVGNTEGNNLYVMRIAVEPGLDGTLEGEVACAALLQAAQREAHGWHMESVVVWNPSEMVQRAAARALGKQPGEIEVVERAKEGIASLKWYSADVDKLGTAKASVQWIANEKFAWC